VIFHGGHVVVSRYTKKPQQIGIFFKISCWIKFQNLTLSTARIISHNYVYSPWCYYWC